MALPGSRSAELSSGADATDLIGLVSTAEGLVVAGTIFGPDADHVAIWISVDEGITWEEVPNVQNRFGDDGAQSARAYDIAILGDRVVVVGALGGEAMAWVGEWTN